ncbi:MAG: 4Fe-4S dicluster domain-containing protein [Desulfobacterales bacterium]|nr:MAG: 4Fe-4S dicluster domain-containing protein [Desulfobacterales bacterium]
MKTVNQYSADRPIDISRRDSNFTSNVMQRSGVNINLCWHCQSCAGGCPFVNAMDYPPNRVIRLIQLGLRKEALESSGIWVCVGCNTCSIQCPNAIDIPAVNDALREMAIEEGVVVAEPDILNFHREVLHSVKRYGRTHKFEIMLRYKLRRHDWFSDAAVGLKMFIKRKLELLPSRSRDMKTIKRLFDHKQTVEFDAK